MTKPKTKRAPSVFEQHGMIWIGIDKSFPRYALFQNDRGGFERWQVVDGEERPEGERVMRGRRAWFVFVEDIE